LALTHSGRRSVSYEDESLTNLLGDDAVVTIFDQLNGNLEVPKAEPMTHKGSHQSPVLQPAEMCLPDPARRRFFSSNNGDLTEKIEEFEK